MKHYNEVEEKVIVKKYSLSTCDRCGKEIILGNFNAYREDWFSLNFGNNFPEGSCGPSYVMELCEDCSRKMIELLSDNGYDVRKETWEY